MPVKSNYYPLDDESKDLDAENTQYYQELIGMLGFLIELGHIDIL